MIFIYSINASRSKYAGRPDIRPGWLHARQWRGDSLSGLFEPGCFKTRPPGCAHSAGFICRYGFLYTCRSGASPRIVPANGRCAGLAAIVPADLSRRGRRSYIHNTAPDALVGAAPSPRPLAQGCANAQRARAIENRAFRWRDAIRAGSPILLIRAADPNDRRFPCRKRGIPAAPCRVRGHDDESIPKPWLHVPFPRPDCGRGWS